eukprot:7386800-Prymnesium_polylepis.2
MAPSALARVVTSPPTPLRGRGRAAVVQMRIVVRPAVDLLIITIVCLPEQSMGLDSVVAHCVRRPNLHIHPQRVDVRCTDARLRCREPLAVGDC